MKRKILPILLVLICLVSAFAVSAIAASNDPTLDIEAANLSFEDSVYVLYAVSHDGIAAENVKLLFWTEPQSADGYVYGTQSYAKDYVADNVSVNGESCVVFKNNELRAKNMADYVYARAYAEVDGVEYYSEVSKYSILQYAYNKLGKTGTESKNEALKNMLVSMLEYGADAQVYANHNTDRLADADYYQITLTDGTFGDGSNKSLCTVDDISLLTGEISAIVNLCGNTIIADADIGAWAEGKNLVAYNGVIDATESEENTAVYAGVGATVEVNNIHIYGASGMNPIQCYGGTMILNNVTTAQIGNADVSWYNSAIQVINKIVMNEETGKYAVTSQANLTVDGGMYSGDKAIQISAPGGNVTIGGGTFTGTTYVIQDDFAPQYYTDGANYESKIVINGGNFNGNIKITDATVLEINGGTFVCNDATAEIIKAHIADGATVTINGVTYVDGEPVVLVSTADELKAALAAKEEKITLGANIEIEDAPTVGFDFTVNHEVELNLNGYNITSAHNSSTGVNNNNGVFLVDSKGVLTLTGKGDITFKTNNQMGWNAMTAVIATRGDVVIDGAVKVSNLGGTDMSYGIDMWAWGSANVDLTINAGMIHSAAYRAVRMYYSGGYAKDFTINMNGGVITADNNCAIMLHDGNSTNKGNYKLVMADGTIASNGYYNGAERAPIAKFNGTEVIDCDITGGQILQNGADVTEDYIDYNNAGDNNAEYTYVATADELKAALAAKNAKIALSANIDIATEIVASAATNYDFKITYPVEINLNGYNITSVHNVSAYSVNTAYNHGVFLVEAAGVLTLNGKGDVTISQTGNNMVWSATSAVIATRGDVVIDGAVKVSNLGGTDMSYGIDMWAWGSETVDVTIKAGMVHSAAYRAIRMYFSNSSNEKFTLNIEGGVITADNNCAIMLHDGSSANQGDYKLVMTGGTIASNGYTAAGAERTPFARFNGTEVIDCDITGGQILQNGADVTESYK